MLKIESDVSVCKGTEKRGVRPLTIFAYANTFLYNRQKNGILTNTASTKK